MSIKSTTLSGGTPDTIYQSATTTAVTTTYFCNRSMDLVSINVHLVPSGQLATQNNLIYWSVNISSSDTFVMDTERLILDPGDSIVAVASDPDSIIATVSYVEV